MDQAKAKIDQACRTAEEFTKLYYETADKRRHLMSRLYLDTGLLSWNGNGITGNESIQKFVIDLPPTDHHINTLDAQPILDSAVSGQLTFMIQKINMSDCVPYGCKPAKKSAVPAKKASSKKISATKPKSKTAASLAAGGCCCSRSRGCGSGSKKEKYSQKSKRGSCYGRKYDDYSSFSDSSCSDSNCSDCYSDGYDSTTDSYTDDSYSSNEGCGRQTSMNSCKR